MIIVFKIIALPLFFACLFVFGVPCAVIGKGDNVMDFIDWYQE